MVAWWKQFLACHLTTCWSVKKMMHFFYDHVCGHIRACVQRGGVLLRVQSQAYGWLRMRVKSHCLCWEMQEKRYKSRAVVDGWRAKTDWKKHRWDLLDQNSVCWSVWERSGGVRWQVSLTWLLLWHEGLIPCKGLTSEKFKRASVSTPPFLKPSEYYKIITTTNQFTVTANT